jgi:hypothetical protein
MSFSSPATSIIETALNFTLTQLRSIADQEVQNCGRTIVNLSTTGKEFSKEQLERINELVSKYSAYNSEYVYAYEHQQGLRDGFPGGNPQLLDALFTGYKLPFSYSRFDEYHQEIEHDIKEIVVLTPQSMTCTIGTLRCRAYVPPLAAACINENIPLHIVEFLLEKGANPNATYDLNGQPIDILSDLKKNIPTERFGAIELLFNKYKPN